MKTRSILMCCLLAFLCSNAQENNKDIYKKIYKFYRSAQLQQCKLNGELVRDKNNVENVLPGYEFRVIDKIGDFYVIRFSRWTDENHDYLNVRLLGKADLSLASPKFTGSYNDEEVSYFKLPVSAFTDKCELAFLRHSFTVGALVLPIKMRFGAKSADGTQVRDFSFSGDVSLGFSAGYKYTKNGKVAHNLLTGLAITSVPVSAATTNKFISEETNLAAITWHFGYLLEIERFQFGAFTGIDHMAGEAGRQWVYKNKPWLGIGIGFSILNPKKTSETQ